MQNIFGSKILTFCSNAPSNIYIAVISGWLLYTVQLICLYYSSSDMFLYVRFQVLTAASMMFRAVFWVVLFYTAVQPRRQLWTCFYTSDITIFGVLHTTVLFYRMLQILWTYIRRSDSKPNQAMKWTAIMANITWKLMQIKKSVPFINQTINCDALGGLCSRTK
jgi:hypothetical protein